MNQSVAIISWVWVTKKDGKHISRAIQVSFVTVRPHETIVNSDHILLEKGKMFPSVKRFRPPLQVMASVEDAVLYKFEAD